jgi:hypothetical protein
MPPKSLAKLGFTAVITGFADHKHDADPLAVALVIETSSLIQAMTPVIHSRTIATCLSLGQQLRLSLLIGAFPAISPLDGGDFPYFRYEAA